MFLLCLFMLLLSGTSRETFLRVERFCRCADCFFWLTLGRSGLRAQFVDNTYKLVGLCFEIEPEEVSCFI